MADRIEINIGTLSSDIQSMEIKLRELRSEMEKVFTAVRELDAMWNGPANLAFNQAFRSDYEAMKELCKTMESLISYMQNARDEYRRCENAVSSEIDAIRM